jgi:hypothetical protein
MTYAPSTGCAHEASCVRSHASPESDEQPDAESCGHLVSEKGVQHSMPTAVLPVGSLVDVTNYGPFRGLKGTIQTVNTIADEGEEPFCLYLVALQGAHIHEPVWFEHDEVEAAEVVTSPVVDR